MSVNGPADPLDRPGVYAARRARVFEALGAGGALVLPAAPEVRVGRDLELRYRPDPDLFYLTGYPEPGAIAVLCPDHEAAPFTLFVRPRDPGAELWTGPRGGPEAARDFFGADAAHHLDELEIRLPEILKGTETLYAPLAPAGDRLGRILLERVASARIARQRTGRGLRTLRDPGSLLDPMRLVKDAHELERIREAARITAAGFRAAAATVRPGAGEWEVEAALEAAFRRAGSEGSAFAPIVAGGVNATVLHYVDNHRRLEARTLLLVDAGARYRMYNGDVSRTFPVSGRFEPLQRDLYEAVLAARAAAIAVVRPGATVEDVHRAAVSVLLRALLDHGLLEGEVDVLIEREQSYKPFYPHRTSHWLGLDVHDVGEYRVKGESRKLEPGMVLTVEPGLYCAATSGDGAGVHGDPDPGGTGQEAPPPAVPERYRGIGIRIEDDVLVTSSGCELLTADLPVGIVEVETMLEGGEP